MNKPKPKPKRSRNTNERGEENGGQATPVTRVERVEKEVMEAYADCHIPGMRGRELRKLIFAASDTVSRDEAKEILKKAIPDGHKGFDINLLDGFPSDCEITISREGCVCLYVLGKRLPCAYEVLAAKRQTFYTSTHYMGARYMWGEGISEYASELEESSAHSGIPAWASWLVLSIILILLGVVLWGIIQDAYFPTPRIVENTAMADRPIRSAPIPRPPQTPSGADTPGRSRVFTGWSESSDGNTWNSAPYSDKMKLCQGLAEVSSRGNSAAFFYRELEEFYDSQDPGILNMKLENITAILEAGSQALPEAMRK